MTPFQFLAGGFMLLLASGELYLLVVGKSRRLISGLRLAVWLLAATLIFFPHATAPVAEFLSIGRGADVLLYLTVIAFLLSFFYVIHALERQREQLTYLVRSLAVNQPVHIPKSPRTVPEQSQPVGDSQS